MIEHVSLRCKNVSASKKFYEKVLAPLGYRVKFEYPDAAGFMAGGHTSFWVTKAKKGAAGHGHIAFRAKDEKMVDAFYRAAMKAGARDNGAPGLRPEYSATYYAAFILDPDGHNMEAVAFVKGAAKKKT
jgi:catechol 2,3-dioxygenase-like lactoylglutathione lyase family enzyme